MRVAFLILHGKQRDQVPTFPVSYAVSTMMTLTRTADLGCDVAIDCAILDEFIVLTVGRGDILTSVFKNP